MKCSGTSFAAATDNPAPPSERSRMTHVICVMPLVMTAGLRVGIRTWRRLVTISMGSIHLRRDTAPACGFSQKADILYPRQNVRSMPHKQILRAAMQSVLPSAVQAPRKATPRQRHELELAAL